MTSRTAKLPSTAVGRRRLLRLAGLLDENARNRKGVKFDLSLVCQRSDGEDFESTEEPELNCNTTACAIGLWGISRKFRNVSCRVYHGQLYPVFNGLAGQTAAEAYFNLWVEESSWLFLDNHYSGPTTGAAGERAVAKRIRQFVAGRVSP